MAQVLDIPRSRLREAVTQVNALPDEQRLPFVRVFLQGIAIGDVVLELQADFMDVLGQTRAAIVALQAGEISKER